MIKVYEVGILVAAALVFLALAYLFIRDMVLPGKAAKVSGLDASHLRVKAGDTVIITTDELLSTQQIEHIKVGAACSLPYGCQVMVLHGGLKVSGVIHDGRAIPHIPMPRPA